MEAAVLDDIIDRLLAVKARPGKQVQLSEAEIRQLCLVSKDIFMRQPNLLELQAPVKICGTPLALFIYLFLNSVFFDSSIGLWQIGCRFSPIPVFDQGILLSVRF